MNNSHTKPAERLGDIIRRVLVDMLTPEQYAYYESHPEQAITKILEALAPLKQSVRSSVTVGAATSTKTAPPFLQRNSTQPPLPVGKSGNTAPPLPVVVLTSTKKNGVSHIVKKPAAKGARAPKAKVPIARGASVPPMMRLPAAVSSVGGGDLFQVGEPISVPALDAKAVNDCCPQSGFYCSHRKLLTLLHDQQQNTPAGVFLPCIMKKNATLAVLLKQLKPEQPNVVGRWEALVAAGSGVNLTQIEYIAQSLGGSNNKTINFFLVANDLKKSNNMLSVLLLRRRTDNLHQVDTLDQSYEFKAGNQVLVFYPS